MKKKQNKGFFKKGHRFISGGEKGWYKSGKLNRNWKGGRQTLSARNRKYYLQHKEHFAEQHLLRRRKALEIYSKGKFECACCGEKIIEFLAIDHIHNDGNEHRKKFNITNIYKWLEKKSYPSGFQVLCHNCNSAKGFYGKCPHIKICES